MKNKYSNKYIIETGMGLQDVDGLKNSSYFLNESNKYIKGEITLEEFDRIVDSYYKNKPDTEDRSEEADKVSIRIAKLISDDSFVFTVGQLITIHKVLFDGIYEHAGQLRTYNFSKKEWVLDGASVTYGDFRELKMTLQYDFDLERRFKYESLSIDDKIMHLAIFVANLWQIHAFEEGNTRTTAVFFIKYLRRLGFDVTNDAFAKNAWYFRNALVRANYTNISKDIYEDFSFLVKFLRNLLLGEKNPLKNRYLHIATSLKEETDESREAKIIAQMKDNSHITTEEMARNLDVSVRTIKTVIKRLTENGFISRKGGKKLGQWVVNENYYPES